jgi:hypothetical protein
MRCHELIGWRITCRRGHSLWLRKSISKFTDEFLHTIVYADYESSTTWMAENRHVSGLPRIPRHRASIPSTFSVTHATTNQKKGNVWQLQ